MKFQPGEAVWVNLQRAAGVVVCGHPTPGKVNVAISNGPLFTCAEDELIEMRWTFLGPMLWPSMRRPLLIDRTTAKKMQFGALYGMTVERLQEIARG